MNNIVATSGEGMEKGDCARRAFSAGLRYAGFTPPFKLSENLKWSNNLRAYAKELGLEVYTEGVVNSDDRPCLIVYKVPESIDDTVEGQKDVYHVVFVSDAAPFYRYYEIHTMVLGWENLNVPRWKRIFRKFVKWSCLNFLK